MLTRLLEWLSDSDIPPTTVRQQPLYRRIQVNRRNDAYLHGDTSEMETRGLLPPSQESLARKWLESEWMESLNDK